MFRATWSRIFYQIVYPMFVSEKLNKLELIFEFMNGDAHISHSFTVQAATVLPPGCVLSRALACIQMGLITTTFHGKIGTFEEFFASVCGHLAST